MAELTNEHNVVKYASSGFIDNGVVTGHVFARRIGEDDGLSVNWLEHYPAPVAAQITEIFKCSGVTVRKSGRYAEVCVGAAAEAVAKLCNEFSAVENPLEADDKHPADPSHCLFLGLPDRAVEEDKALMVGDLISMKVHALHTPPL